HDVLERVGLPITVGVARTKFLAKVASGVAKPDGLLVVPPDRELAFLHPLAVERLWGVGPVTADKLHDRGITTVGEVARLAEAMPIIERLGLTLIGVAVGNLDDDGAVQLVLPFDRHSDSALDVALDGVRERFGSAAVTRAVLLGRDPGLTVPLLPD